MPNEVLLVKLLLPKVDNILYLLVIIVAVEKLKLNLLIWLLEILKRVNIGEWLGLCRKRTRTLSGSSSSFYNKTVTAPGPIYGITLVVTSVVATYDDAYTEISSSCRTYGRAASNWQNI